MKVDDPQALYVYLASRRTWLAQLSRQCEHHVATLRARVARRVDAKRPNGPDFSTRIELFVAESQLAMIRNEAEFLATVLGEFARPEPAPPPHPDLPHVFEPEEGLSTACAICYASETAAIHDPDLRDPEPDEVFPPNLPHAYNDAEGLGLVLLDLLRAITAAIHDPDLRDPEPDE